MTFSILPDMEIEKNLFEFAGNTARNPQRARGLEGGDGERNAKDYDRLIGRR